MRKKENKVKPKHKINKEITHDLVKLVHDSETETMRLSEALIKADELDMDLVLMSEHTRPPVVKIMDYGKYLYKLSKSQSASKPKPIKEVRFTPNISDNDIKFKTNNVANFLTSGHKVKAYVMFKGREITFKDKGEKLLLELALAMEELGTMEAMPKLEGKRMTIFIKPKTK